MISIVTPGIKSYTKTISGEPRVFVVEVPPSPEMAFIFFKGSAKTDKGRELFNSYLNTYKIIGIYPEAFNRNTTKIKPEWSLKQGADTQKDVDFFKYIKSQLPAGMPLCISGVSNGGVFALYLASNGYCNVVCTFAAAVFQGMSITSKPNILSNMGKLDRSVNFYGGLSHGFLFLPAYDSIMKFTVPPVLRTVSGLPNGGELNKYTSPNQSNIVRLITCANDGHSVMVSYTGIDLIGNMFKFFQEASNPIT